MGWKVSQTWSFRGSKSRNKVSVGEPAEGSLNSTTDYICKYDNLLLYTIPSTLFPCCFREAVTSSGRLLRISLLGEPAVGEISLRKVNYKSNYVFILCLNRFFFSFFF
jgi:hypothetical protein